MIKFFLFIKKIHFLLLFILLESLAIHYYANSTSYTKVKLVTASNYVVGGIYSQISGLNSYFHLRRENQELARELAVLRNRLDGMKVPLSADDSLSLAAGDSSVLYANGVRQYEYFSAKVVNNTITRQENYITVDLRWRYRGVYSRMFRSLFGLHVGAEPRFQNQRSDQRY